MGALPQAGQWVRLAVPAALLGLEGKVLDGMAFSLYDGRATWDYTGVAQSAAEPRLAISGVVTALGDGQPLSGVSLSGGDCTTTDATGQYSCQVVSGWSGTLVPALAGYDFTPAQRSFTDVTADQWSQDFTAAAQAQQETIWIEDVVPGKAGRGRVLTRPRSRARWRTARRSPRASIIMGSRMRPRPWPSWPMTR